MVCRGSIDARLIKWLNKTRHNSNILYYLIDNIDSSAQASSLIKGFLSTLFNNKGNNNKDSSSSSKGPYVFLTSHSLSNLDPWFALPMNASHVKIEPPTADQRKHMIDKLLVACIKEYSSYIDISKGSIYGDLKGPIDNLVSQMQVPLLTTTTSIYAYIC